MDPVRRREQAGLASPRREACVSNAVEGVDRGSERLSSLPVCRPLAGIEDFVKPFLNLRSTRSTEFVERGIPIKDSPANGASATMLEPLSGS